jgi:DNA adenine methylase
VKKSDVLIKWTGSKRFQADQIVKYFPKEINRYLEPFAGSCSILWEVMNSDIQVNSYVVSDLNIDLINLWNEVKEHPYKLSIDYKFFWEELNSLSDDARNSFWYKMRDEFNEFRESSLFLFINRTAYNGLVRYNANGDFNTSFHFSRNGIEPSKLSEIIFKWSEMLNLNKVIFNNEHYVNVIGGKSVFIYLDPPYSDSGSMYFGKINYDELFHYLIFVKSKWALSFDGFRGEQSRVYDVPQALYKNHILIPAGKSSFSKLKGSEVEIRESLYLNF